MGSTVGELGCWVDPSVTRLIQTGLEHSRVPDVGTYLELGNVPCRRAHNIVHSFNLRFDESQSILYHAFKTTIFISPGSRQPFHKTCRSIISGISSTRYRLPIGPFNGAEGSARNWKIYNCGMGYSTFGNASPRGKHWYIVIVCPSLSTSYRLIAMILLAKMTPKLKEPFALDSTRPRIAPLVFWFYDILKLWHRLHKFLKLEKV